MPFKSQEITNIPIPVKDGITLFPGKISRNLLFEPMGSHAYWLEDEDDVVIFDSKCGKKIAEMIKSHILSRRNDRKQYFKIYESIGQ